MHWKRTVERDLLYIEHASSRGHRFSSFLPKRKPKPRQEDIRGKLVTKQDVSDEASFPASVVAMTGEHICHPPMLEKHARDAVVDFRVSFWVPFRNARLR